MRKFAIASIAAFAAMGFAAAQADGDCGWGAHKTAATPIPAKTAASTKSAPKTAIPTKETLAQDGKATKTEKGS